MEQTILKFEATDFTLSITTNMDNWGNLWKTFEKRVGSDAWTYSNYASSCPGELFLIDMEKAKSPTGKPGTFEWDNQYPTIFEVKSYHFKIKFKKPPVHARVIHPLKKIVDGFTNDMDPTDTTVTAVRGFIDFLNQPGIFTLCFEYEYPDGVVKKEHFTFDVISPKLDTRKDMPAMLNAINDEYEGYIFEYLTLTYQSLKAIKKPVQTASMWLSIFRHVAKKYFYACRFVIEQPNNRSERTTCYAKADKIKKWSRTEEERFKLNEANFGLEEAANRYYPYTQIIRTSNTRENRFVKYTLKSLSKKFGKIKEQIIKKYEDKLSDDEKKELEHFQKTFQQILKHPFFKSVDEFEGFKQESRVLQQRSGYSTIYKTWIILRRSLELQEDLNTIGLKQVWELYEIWCFIMMKRLIIDIINPCHIDYSPTKDKTLDPLLDNSIEQIITFYRQGDAAHEYPITLRYQHRYNIKNGTSATTEQKPDIVLEITLKGKKAKDKFVLTYLFDAKYRVDMDTSPDSGLDVGLDDPIPDTLDQMHRYRDAILYQKAGKMMRENVGGYILFPGRTAIKDPVTKKEAAEDKYFYKSIDTVNIGAFPFLPKDKTSKDVQSQLIRKHLEKILNETNVYRHIHNTIPQKGLTYKKSSLIK